MKSRRSKRLTSASEKSYHNKDWLYDQYINQKKSTTIIAKEQKSSVGNIYHWLKKLKIQTRSIRESLTGLNRIAWNKGLKGYNSGEKNGFFGKHHTEETKRKLSEILKGNKRNWKGGRAKSGGYIHIYKPDHPRASKDRGYVAEHIFVMEKHIGRYLWKWERVHHINGIKTDDRPENLIELTPSEHVKLHNLKRKGAK